MKKYLLIAGAAMLPFALPGAAYAQDAAGAHPYVGVQIGHHDLGVDDEGLDDEDFDIDDSALTYGVYAGADFDLGPSAIVGIEGNFNLASGPIDTEYGVAARIGARVGNGTVIFARAGYQWVNLDLAGLVGLDEDLIDDDEIDVDDTIGGYLVGVGADIGVGTNMGVRVAVDTIEFDTLRPTLGLHVRF